MTSSRYNYINTGEPTYWPTDLRPAWFFYKGISLSQVGVNSSFDLSSNYYPIILTLSSTFVGNEKRPYWTNSKTDCSFYKAFINDYIDLKIPLKTANNIDQAVEFLTNTLQDAAYLSMPEAKAENKQAMNNSLSVKIRIAEKRRARKKWQMSRHSDDKTKLNKLSTELTNLLHKTTNEHIQVYLQRLSPWVEDNYFPCGKSQNSWKSQLTILYP